LTGSTTSSRSPLVVVVAGEAPVPLLQTLGAALPDAAVGVVSGVEVDVLRAASAHAHLVIGVEHGVTDGRDGEFHDAIIRTEEDLSRFIRRAQDFDRRRLTGQLPPDIAAVMDPWSPAWSSTAMRVGVRISAAFDGIQADADHIGSTSVPGLKAKGIIDLQVAVADLAECDSVDGRLKDAGFVNVQEIVPEAPGVRRDNARGVNASDEEWAKRLYASVDSAQRVIVHVRRRGAANWRYALLFRDWLRSSPTPREEYAAVKSELAALREGDSHFDDYARAKDFWFDQAHRTMESWARATGWSPAARE